MLLIFIFLLAVPYENEYKFQFESNMIINYLVHINNLKKQKKGETQKLLQQAKNEQKMIGT